MATIPSPEQTRSKMPASHRKALNGVGPIFHSRGVPPSQKELAHLHQVGGLVRPWRNHRPELRSMNSPNRSNSTWGSSRSENHLAKASSAAFIWQRNGRLDLCARSRFFTRANSSRGRSKSKCDGRSRSTATYDTPISFASTAISTTAKESF